MLKKFFIFYIRTFAILYNKLRVMIAKGQNTRGQKLNLNGKRKYNQIS